MLRQGILGLLVLLVTSSPFYAADNQLTDLEQQAGWRLLFDGQTTTGWMTPKGQPLPDKHVQDGCLNPHPCDYMLTHEKVWENFKLSLDFKTSVAVHPGSNTDSTASFPRL